MRFDGLQRSVPTSCKYEDASADRGHDLIVDGHGRREDALYYSYCRTMLDSYCSS